jgi:ankyrin repeat protein
MMKLLLIPVLMLILGIGSVHHSFFSTPIKHTQVALKKAEVPAIKREISSEKPVSFDNINTYKVITNNAPIPGPLFLAIKLNQLTKVKELVEKGHNLFELNEKRQNALMMAVELGHDDIFHYLMSQNFDLDHQDIYGMTALMYAAEKNESKMLKIMLKKEHDITILSAKEKSTFDYAKEMHASASLKLLQKVDAPCNTSCEL